MDQADFTSIFNQQKEFFQTGKTFDYNFRITQLKQLKKALKSEEKLLTDAVYKDFQKPANEAFITEIGATLHEIDHSIKHLKRWMRKKRVSTNLVNIPGRSYRIPHPLGSNLIIGAWNYPIFLVLGPLVGCIAAGNTAILKPSELAPHSSSALKEIMEKYFSKEFIAVIEGGVDATQNLLQQPFDHIFFTGSTRVGKIIMKAGAEHLSKVTLELGGKSPAIVDQDADVKMAAKKIVFGKGVNAGQTCIAPDYVMVHVSKKDALLEALKKTYDQFYPTLDHVTSIVNKDHFERLNKIIQQEKVYHQKKYDKERERVIPPTIIYPTDFNQPVMQDEIFGPLLPVMTFGKIDEVVQAVNSRSHPLSLYYFGKGNRKMIEEKIQFGGACINDTLLHIVNPNLPFGGVGKSGQGSYHGYSGFETFSHFKSVLKKGTWIDFSFRYPPYDAKKMKWVRWFFG